MESAKPSERSPLLARAFRTARGAYGIHARGKARSPEDVDKEVQAEEGVVTGLGTAESVTITGMATLLAQKLAERGLPGLATSSRAVQASGDEAKVYDEVLDAHSVLLDHAWPSNTKEEGAPSTSAATAPRPTLEDPDAARGALFLSAVLSLILALGAPSPPTPYRLSVAVDLGLRATSHQATLRLVNLATACIDAYTNAGFREAEINPHRQEDGLVALLWTSYAFGDTSRGGSCGQWPINRRHPS
jgi:hypothetical protein